MMKYREENEKLNFLEKLNDEKLKYNCNYQVTTANGREFCLVYFGSHDFIIINSYYGCVAISGRHCIYDFETDKPEYIQIDYRMKEEAITKSIVEKIIRKNEKTFKCNLEINFDYYGEI